MRLPVSALFNYRESALSGLSVSETVYPSATFSSSGIFVAATPTLFLDLKARDNSDSSVTTEALPTAITNSDVVATSIATELAFAGSLTTETSSSSSSATRVATTSSSAATSTASSTASGSNTTTTTTIIGVVVGVLGSFLIIGLIIYCIMDRKKKEAQRQRLLNEKPKKPAYVPPQTVNGGQAPVRPAPPTGPGSTLRNAPTVPSKDTIPKENNPANPFGTNAEKLHAPESANPFADKVIAGAAISTPGAVAVPLKRRASRHIGPTQLDLTLPQPPSSPTGSDYSVSTIPDGSVSLPTAGSAAIAAAGGPASSAVHRVKLEFKPSLEDELELQTGQLVRLLHEYDDGWALVIRLDRSAQGVVPRTCLSQQPVKPRLANSKPPVAMNNYRPGSRNGQQTRQPIPPSKSQAPGQAY